MLAAVGLPPLPPDAMEELNFCLRGVAIIVALAYWRCYEQLVPNHWLSPGAQVRRHQRSGGYTPC